jgi:hypothetical protein
LIITLWSFQILNKYSYRENIEKAKDEGFGALSLCDNHYRVRQLDDKLLKNILEACTKLLLKDERSIGNVLTCQDQFKAISYPNILTHL